MKLRKEFITHESDGAQVMVAAGDVGFYGLVRSNQTAAFIINKLKEETTKEQIVSDMAVEYDAPREVIARDVEKILDKLRSIGALDE